MKCLVTDQVNPDTGVGLDIVVAEAVAFPSCVMVEGQINLWRPTLDPRCPRARAHGHVLGNQLGRGLGTVLASTGVQLSLSGNASQKKCLDLGSLAWKAWDMELSSGHAGHEVDLRDTAGGQGRGIWTKEAEGTMLVQTLKITGLLTSCPASEEGCLNRAGSITGGWS